MSTSSIVSPARFSSTLLAGVFVSALGFHSSALGAEPPSLPFGFSDTEIFLSDYNTRELRTGDFNQDGRLDILVLNTDKGRLDFYYQNDPETGKAETPQMHQDRWEPVLSHPRFTKESLIPGAQLFSLEVGDFNQDGQIDFATVNGQNQLDIYHGPLDGVKKPTHSFTVNGHRGYIECLRWHEEDQTLYYLGPDLLETLHWDDQDKTYISGKISHLPDEQNPYRLQFVDLNNDGKSDIIYELDDEEYGLAIHLREDDEWLPMQRPLLEPASSYFIPSSQAGELFAIHNDSGAIQSFQFRDVPEKESERAVSIEEIHLPAMRQAGFITLEGKKGLQSLLIFSPGQSKIEQLDVDENGRLGFPRSHTVPAGCEWVLEGRFLDEKSQSTHLLLHNPKNRYLGLIPVTDGEISFPLPIPNEAAFISVQTWRPEGSDTDQLVGILREEKRKIVLKRWKLVKEEDQIRLEELQHLDLEDVKRDPEALFPLPPEKNRADGFLVTSPLGESFYLFESEDDSGDLKVVKPPKGYSSEQLKKKRARNFRHFPSGLSLPSSWAYLDGNEIQVLFC